MGRALSVSDLMNKRYKLLEFEGQWEAAFSQPERYGTWLVWGGSGNGKTTFVLELAKYMCQFGRVAYVSQEESSAYTMRLAFERVGMQEVVGKMILIEREDVGEIMQRLAKPKSPDVVIIDSLQYSDMNWSQYKKLKESNPKKLIVFISHAEGKMPEGRIAKKVMHDAALKIYVEGYRAFSKGRYIGSNGGVYEIWKEGAERYWGN